MCVYLWRIRRRGGLCKSTTRRVDSGALWVAAWERQSEDLCEIER